MPKNSKQKFGSKRYNPCLPSIVVHLSINFWFSNDNSSMPDSIDINFADHLHSMVKRVILLAISMRPFIYETLHLCYPNQQSPLCYSHHGQPPRFNNPVKTPIILCDNNPRKPKAFFWAPNPNFIYPNPKAFGPKTLILLTLTLTQNPNFINPN